MQRFLDRKEAGRALAEALAPYAEASPVVIALPRGGVPVGYEIAVALGAPLDIWVVRKVGVPWHPELGIGAVSEGSYVYLSRGIIEQVGLTEREVERAVQEKVAELETRVNRLRGDRPRPELRGRTVILVDDGIATGGTARTAIRAIRAQEPRAIVLAVPVVQRDTVALLRAEVDGLVALLTPAHIQAIGLWYVDFAQLTDAEVTSLLERASGRGRRDAAEEERGATT